MILVPSKFDVLKISLSAQPSKFHFSDKYLFKNTNFPRGNYQPIVPQKNISHGSNSTTFSRKVEDCGGVYSLSHFPTRWEGRKLKRKPRMGLTSWYWPILTSGIGFCFENGSVDVIYHTRERVFHPGIHREES